MSTGAGSLAGWGRRSLAALGMALLALPGVAQVEEDEVAVKVPLYQRMADNFVLLLQAGWNGLRSKPEASASQDSLPRRAAQSEAMSDASPDAVPASQPDPILAKANARAQKGGAVPPLAQGLIAPSPSPALPPVAAKGGKPRKPSDAVVPPDREEDAASPMTSALKSNAEIGRGLSSWYGPGLSGRKTASGEVFDMEALTAAHRTLPFGSKVRVRNLENGREVVVRINDRGPHTKGRIIDLSRKAAEALDVLKGEHMVMLLPG